MRTRLSAAAVWILILPIWFSATSGDKLPNSAPFATVALAGHTLTGDWCACGTPECVCDLRDRSGNNAGHRDENEISLDEAASVSADSGIDFGSGVLMFALALFVWVRLRA